MSSLTSIVSENKERGSLGVIKPWDEICHRIMASIQQRDQMRQRLWRDLDIHENQVRGLSLRAFHRCLAVYGNANLVAEAGQGIAQYGESQ